MQTPARRRTAAGTMRQRVGKNGLTLYILLGATNGTECGAMTRAVVQSVRLPGRRDVSVVTVAQ